MQALKLKHFKLDEERRKDKDQPKVGQNWVFYFTIFRQFKDSNKVEWVDRDGQLLRFPVPQAFEMES
jgi:hypothetical protein